MAHPMAKPSLKEVLRNPKVLIGFFLGSLTIQAMGVVFADIGTSPIYSENVAFTALGGHPSYEDILGVVSTMLWSIILIPFLWYTIILLRTDFHKEGGITALMSRIKEKMIERYGIVPELGRLLWKRQFHTFYKQMGGILKDISKYPPFWILLVGLIGVGALFADGMITPAISVLSAVEGTRNLYPSLSTELIVTITILILIGLFAIQKLGTGFVGKLFGPIMLVWFATLGIFGIRAIMIAPQILEACNPLYAFHFLVTHPLIGGALDGIILCFTGSEALYADLGHFGKSPIRKAWGFFVMPCLMFQYMGQGAMVLYDPKNATNTMFATVPTFLYGYMVVISTLAVIIASQALITGGFSLYKSLSAIGMVPKLALHSTSDIHEGQIYISKVNWGLFLGAFIMVYVFRESARLANAYGLAVTCTMLATVILMIVDSVYVKRWPFSLPFWAKVVICIVGYGGTIGVVIGMFFVANFSKLFQGGAVPAVMTIVFSAYMIFTLNASRKNIRIKQQTLETPTQWALEKTNKQPSLKLVCADWPIHLGLIESIIEASHHDGDVLQILHIDCHRREKEVYDAINNQLAKFKLKAPERAIELDQIKVVCHQQTNGDIPKAIEAIVRQELENFQEVHVYLSPAYIGERRAEYIGEAIEDRLKPIAGTTIHIKSHFIGISNANSKAKPTVLAFKRFKH